MENRVPTTQELTVDNIIEFPLKEKPRQPELDQIIAQALQGIPSKHREKLKFELIKTIDSYDSLFTEWKVNLPKETDPALIKQLYQLAHQEHGRKMRLLADIIKLKLENLVASYRQR